ncbi:T9SS type A sorting domain-containing protein [Epilithonimonas hominis]|uniref:Por secretion system C-terminal sorting domain-containing protein n=1 Tax=Epilithonimonas hominis TaxID=420404 RepID=A0A1H6L6X1_9FLAO|nr:T9SS type A sorting domain-containing protein [Epilithonimonas hominis]SEH84037.1 Por secretion system C-terminal sorting domain-containing protein [Epilithonimonas hominis]
MKTYLTQLSVFCIIFLLNTHLKAQGEEAYPYRGGNADGFATETITNTICSTPFHQYAYFGGNGDGFATETLENATCSTPFHQYAYFGGSGDGFATETVENSNCPTPYHFYAYFGGNGDGFAKDKTEDVCPINPPVANFVADKTNICVGQTVVFTDTSTNSPTGWNWTFSGGSPATATTKTVNVNYNTPGLYQVKLVVANYNETDTMTKAGYINVVTDCSSLGMENIKIDKVLVFPNPAKEVLCLQSPKEVQKIEIFDMSGRKILQKIVNKKEDQINIEILKSGIYILKTYTDNSSQTFKIIKKD